MNTKTVTREMTLELIDASGTATTLQAQLHYEASDPYAVSAVFDTGETQVRWVFGRDLLAEGLFDPTGDGDVHVWPCLDPRGHAVTVIELSSPDGEALLQARSDDLSDFLARTEALVPTGTEAEHLDIDDIIGKLLVR